MKSPFRSTHIVALSCLVLTLVLPVVFTSGCGRQVKKVNTAPTVSTSEAKIGEIAAKENVDKRILLSAAYSQSNFGNPSDPKLVADSARPSLYGMPLATTGPIEGNDVGANTRLLAAKMAEIARASPPAKPFDWLVIAASLIIGQVSDDPNIRDLTLRTVLVDLINTYNNGFTTIVGGETLAVPPLSGQQRIEYADLDERQVQYINGFRFRRDFGSDFYLTGSQEFGLEEKDPTVTPRLLVVWCPGSSLVCLDSLRKNKEAPVHFLATHSLDGGMETTQFYPILQDLNWHGTVLKNTTILAVAGLAGRTAENFRPDWLDFEAYSALRGIVRTIFDQTLRKFYGAVEADKQLQDPLTFASHVVEYTASVRGSLGVTFPDGATERLLPYFWDSKVFWEQLLAARPARIKEQLLISSPFVGEEFSTTDVPFSVLLSEDVRSLEIFQDAQPPPPSDPGTLGLIGETRSGPWERVMLREVNPATKQRENFSHPFTRTGTLGADHRAVKIVARDADGSLLASRVIRFRVKPLAKK